MSHEASRSGAGQTELEVIAADDQICIGPHFKLNLQRTLRIPDDGQEYPLPPGLGRFPIESVADHADRVPDQWLEAGGFFVPIHSREALWLSFEVSHWRACALKVGAGRINAISGDAWSPDLVESPAAQDYVVCPDQPWLDGFNSGDGFISQFVAVPLGLGYTAEEQISGDAKVGGIQVRVYEPKPGRFPDAPPEGMDGDLDLVVHACMDAVCDSAPPSLGLGSGGRMRQEVYPDHYGIDTWDVDCAGEVFIHLADPATYREVTGREAPPSPVTAETYTRFGFPWFELPGAGANDVAPSSALAGLKTIHQIDQAKGAAGDGTDDSVSIPNDQIQKLGGLGPPT